VTRDHELADAEDFVRDFSQRPISGVGRSQTTFDVTRTRNGLCVRYHEGADSSAERKLYAKRHNLVRTELSLRSRKAVAALLRRAASYSRRTRPTVCTLTSRVPPSDTAGCLPGGETDRQQRTSHAGRGPNPNSSFRAGEAFGCARLVVTGQELVAGRALVGRFAGEQAAA